VLECAAVLCFAYIIAAPGNIEFFSASPCAPAACPSNTTSDRALLVSASSQLRSVPCPGDFNSLHFVQKKAVK
jgi:hypothetical protein